MRSCGHQLVYLSYFLETYRAIHVLQNWRHLLRRTATDYKVVRKERETLSHSLVRCDFLLASPQRRMKHAPISVPNAKRQLLGTCRSLTSAIAARNFQNFWTNDTAILANEE